VQWFPYNPNWACPQIRPISKRTELGYLQVGVETYGSGIWHTWYDRDLSVAGRVVVSRDGSFSSKLVKIDRPILRIPSLAIHLDKSANDQFKFNHETEMVPILGLISQQLNVDVDKKTPAPLRSIVSTNHHSVLLALLADELSAAPEEIHDFELYCYFLYLFWLFSLYSSRSLYDTQPAALGGINNEFIFSPRLDNLMSTLVYVSLLIMNSLTSHSLGFLLWNQSVNGVNRRIKTGDKGSQKGTSIVLPSLTTKI
jgi:aspartyl aminopeptidase